MSSSGGYLLLLVLCIIIFCVPSEGVYAFGAGNIPSFAFLEGKAFRHGDIEDSLEEVAKKAGGFALGALIGKGGSKFGGLDIKRVYFGNWLRDYSQAVDVAGLQKLQLQTIINLCMALGFLAHGYATNEFEVTEDRLGVYLPTEHIDNPKGYPDNARQYHPKLRPPVDQRELDIDPRTGMKNYIGNENGGWDTSKALVRRTLERCIQIGRQARAGGNKVDTYESYRLLGQALHTLEDYPAHSNFCELSLVMFGYHDVFTHVGDQVRIQARDGRMVAPIVTAGTFGSSDFIHSLLGEATDHLSQASVTDLNAELDKARAKSGSNTRGGETPGNSLRSLLSAIPGGNDSDLEREMQNCERIRDGPAQGGKRPEDMTPQELHASLWQVLKFRDSVVKKIEKTIERIPGLGPMIEKLMDSISVFVFTTLEPILRPILKQATSGLSQASGEVINSADQFEVFNNPHSSDPTHSFLSKDHFNLILNEPAGRLGKIILIHTANSVVKAWDDTSINIHHVTEDILQCLFHPNFQDNNSQIQRQMLDYMRTWVEGLGNQKHEILRRLSKDGVRNHKNIRLGSTEHGPGEGTQAQQGGFNAQHKIQGYTNQIPGVSQATSAFGQAQNLLGKFSGPNTGFGRDAEFPGGGSGPSGYPGASTPSHSSHSHSAGPPPPTSGEAASFFNPGGSFPGSGPSSSYAPPPGPQSSFAPPSGPPPSQSYSGFAPPPGPPPGPPSGYNSGYNPGYAPSYSPSPPVGFPSVDVPGSHYPGQSSYPGGPPAGFAPPGGPTGFAPPGGPLGFPDPDMPGAHGHPHHEHHHQHGHGHHHQGPPGGAFGWQ
ncbi:heterokaryon incompatibility protein HET-C [Epithele typhae]|uniref:heterokaryon incompatibility protein HET-C n=1 Tax=Epithele typhae TaxID=378194 RepID=UPI0020072E96|nr:heterokaryon incompatibility protein HET-C [Epithele typhae]KAH9941705.1 heterokaryon incompatibility protein HET-C [Epithele typhae]